MVTYSGAVPGVVQNSGNVYFTRPE